MPHLMNCAHSPTGWCLDCVSALGNERLGLVDSLKKIVAEIRSDNYAPAVDWKAPERTWEPSYSGGDCSKHGRYYGHCHSCEDDLRQAQKHAQRAWEFAKRDRLEALAKAAEELLR